MLKSNPTLIFSLIMKQMNNNKHFVDSLRRKRLAPWNNQPFRCPLKECSIAARDEGFNLHFQGVLHHLEDPLRGLR